MTRKTNKLPETIVPEGFPPSPAELDGAEQLIWARCVSSFPSDFFKEADFSLLAEHCRAAHTCAMLAGRIRATKETGELRTLLALRDTESRRAASLARTLRMPPQSRYDRQRTATACRDSGSKSWAPNPFDAF